MQTSKIYKFLDEKNNFTLHFLEGQKLISDLSTIHHHNQNTFLYLRDSVLTIMTFIGFLKSGEGLGFYIDSEEPYFRFKLETSFSGKMRTLLLPETLESLPEKITGKTRITKTFLNKGAPYTSIVDMNSITFAEIANKILQDSYQIDGKVLLANQSDQSIKVAKLPSPKVDVEDIEPALSTKEYILKYQAKWNLIFEKALLDEEKIIESFTALGLTYLGGQEIEFHCPCSKERMMYGILGIKSYSRDELFEDGKDSIETKCDYCHASYEITKDELDEAENPSKVH